MSAPRDGIDAFAQMHNVSRGYAATYLRRTGRTAEFEALDASFKAEAAIADLEAVQSIDEMDIQDAAEADEPIRELKKTVLTRSERQLRGRLAAHASWAREENPSERTRPAREAMLARFDREVDPDGKLAPDERARRAEHAKKAYYLALALKSAQARRRRAK